MRGFQSARLCRVAAAQTHRGNVRAVPALGRYPKQSVGANFPPMIEAVGGIKLVGGPSEQNKPSKIR
jgi:hypothetical protein